MISFLSIIKLTCKAALRSHIFQFLLAVLIVTVILVPNTISGDGTAIGYIRISLKYNLGVIAFVLSLSTIWLGCFAMTRDMESYQLHMVVSKPTSRIKIWIGKCVGVLIINLVLLFIASLIVYFFMLWQFQDMKLTSYENKVYDEGMELIEAGKEPKDIAEFKLLAKKKEEVFKVENEVMVGRRVFLPDLPDFDARARRELGRRIKLAKENSPGAVPTDASRQLQNVRNIRKELVAQYAEIKFDKYKDWTFSGLPPDYKKPLYFRYRVYVGKISSKEQREVRGTWGTKWYFEINKDDNTVKGGEKQPKQFDSTFVLLRPLMRQIMCGVFNEIEFYRPYRITADGERRLISEDGQVTVRFMNNDPERATLFFQISDGPKLLIKVTGFFQNYMRAVLMIVLQLVILAGIACAAGAVLSMPTAIFVVISYLLFGIFASFLVGTDITMPGTTGFDLVGYWVSRFLMLIIIPMQKFEVSRYVSNGELIEFSYICKVFLSYFMLRGLPIFLLGIWLYWRRELGLVIRK